MRMRRLSFWVGFALLVFLAPATLYAETQEAARTIENLHTTLLKTMKEGKEIDNKKRYEELAPVIRFSFDFPFVARVVLGRYWETLDSQQKQRFIEAFTKLSVATYASNFDAFSGEHFTVASQRKWPGGEVEVKSHLVKANGDSVSLDYVLHQTDKQWQIINVIANGVSDLALKRADYTHFLKTKGFDALLAELNEKIAHYLH